MNLENVAAVVTGGGSGLGRATARALAQRGARVGVIDLNEGAATTVASGIDGLAIVCDVSDAESTASAVDRVIEQFGVPRILINCAGIGVAARIVGRDGPHSLDLFANVIRVNLIGTFNLLRLVSAHMMTLEPITESGGRGVIVNTASVAAYEGQVGQAAYSASKGGVVALTLPAARELASSGIRVLTIAPGMIETPMFGGLSQEVQDQLAAQVPFPRRLGHPSEFAALVEHIIDNELLNGEVIRLDGAIRMQPR